MIILAEQAKQKQDIIDGSGMNEEAVRTVLAPLVTAAPSSWGLPVFRASADVDVELLACVLSEPGLAEVLRDTLAKGFACARAIEDDGRTGVRFSAALVELQIFDRLAAPNDAETFEAVRDEVEPVFGELYDDCIVERTGDDDARKPASLAARTNGKARFVDLLAKLET